MESSHKGKKVFIIGGASGIGLATAKQLLNSDAKVCIMDINEDGLNEVTLSNDCDNLICVKGNATQVNDIQNALSIMVNSFNGLDIFIYCAGIYPKQLLIDMTEDEWDEVMNVNLKGAFLSCKTISKYFIENNVSGHIITISSGSYRFARPGSGHYCASKAGLVMLTKVLAQELAKYKVFVNTVAPGLVNHPNINENYKQQFSSRIPLGRIGEPEDIASVINMITSPNNTYLTGQVISVDGGVSAGHFGLN